MLLEGTIKQKNSTLREQLHTLAKLTPCILIHMIDSTIRKCIKYRVNLKKVHAIPYMEHNQLLENRRTLS